MGILFFVDADITGPAILWMRRMLAGLGDRVTTLATEVDPGPRYTERYEIAVIRESASIVVWRLLHRLGLTPSVRSTRSAVDAMVKAIASERVDVALIHYLTSAVRYDRAWSQTAKPVFVHCHGWDVTWDLRETDRPQRRVHGADYVDRIRALPDHVRFIANSKRTIERLCEIDIPADRIYLKYLGVEVPSASPVSKREQAGEITILYLGRLVDFKGPDVVIRAFDLACRRGLRARLKIAGFGPLHRTCEAARAESLYSDRIELLGPVDATAGSRLRRLAHIFTAHNQTGPQTGQEEAFGVSILEAMADGLPVVTGRNGAIPEVLEDGRQGVLVEPGDIDAHAEAFLTLGRDPELRVKMGQSGWQRARDHFSIEQEISRLLQILGSEPGQDRRRLRPAKIHALGPLVREHCH